MNEERRYALHERLETVLGATEANTLMEHLPPTTWNDLVRQRDIDSMRIAMGSDMERLRGDLRGEMDKRFSKQLWQLITTSIGLQAMTIAAVGIMFANMN